MLYYPLGGNNSMNKRLKEIRLFYKLSQEEFGKKIGLESRGHISTLESGKKNITERIVKDVCREFKINEQWLRTGEGNMFSDISDKEAYFNAATDLSSDPLIVSALIEYQRLTDKEKAVISQYAVSVLNRLKEYE